MMMKSSSLVRRIHQQMDQLRCVLEASIGRDKIGLKRCLDLIRTRETSPREGPSIFELSSGPRPDYHRSVTQVHVGRPHFRGEAKKRRKRSGSSRFDNLGVCVICLLSSRVPPAQRLCRCCHASPLPLPVGKVPRRQIHVPDRPFDKSNFQRR